MGVQSIIDIVNKQRRFFDSGITKDISFRFAQLQTLKQLIIDHEDAISQALVADLKKPLLEIYTSEIAIIIKEINNTVRNLKKWSQTQVKAVSWQLLPAFGQIYPEPLGVVLIIGAWNYPVQLNILPLVGAIASGNCSIIKPSEFAPHTSVLLAELISKSFPTEYITVVEGDVETNKLLLQEKFDYVFFTGSSATGKIIMAEAAKHLTPVTLELGGKSPCIVDCDINLQVTARRITWGKFFNAGQSCVSPDYLLVHKNIKQNLLESIAKCIREFYGDNPAESPDYARIINQNQFHRLVEFLKGEILIGGESNLEECYIAPTIINNVAWDDAVMESEIFGPILPVIEYADIDEVITHLKSQPKPLALYLFSHNKSLQKRILRETSSGGVCINDTMKQLFVPSLPFGGVGNSGFGGYHGKASFDTFSHYKSVLNRPSFFDLNLLYAPYAGKLAWLKKLLG
jgi:aldehyde dehydrogenase (NAD+)